MTDVEWLGVMKDLDLRRAGDRGEYGKNELYKTVKEAIWFSKNYTVCMAH